MELQIEESLELCAYKIRLLGITFTKLVNVISCESCSEKHAATVGGVTMQVVNEEDKDRRE